LRTTRVTGQNTAQFDRCIAGDELGDSKIDREGCAPIFSGQVDVDDEDRE
jgi:hypothetical protein